MDNYANLSSSSSSSAPANSRIDNCNNINNARVLHVIPVRYVTCQTNFLIGLNNATCGSAAPNALNNRVRFVAMPNNCVHSSVATYTPTGHIGSAAIPNNCVHSSVATYTPTGHIGSAATPNNCVDSTSACTSRKRRISDYYLSDEEVLTRLLNELEGVKEQLLRADTTISSDELKNKIMDLQHDIDTYYLPRVNRYVPPTSTRRGRIVRPVSLYQNEQFIMGSNNKHTKRRKIDVGKNISR